VNDMYYYSQMEASYSKAASEFWTCA
jgi:hypothetical protein